MEQWRLQQFPFLSSFESINNSVVSSSSFPFQSDHQSVEAALAGLVGLGDIGESSRVTIYIYLVIDFVYVLALSQASLGTIGLPFV